jgi:hypothetical protein
MRVFFSYSFDEDSKFIEGFERLLKSQNISVATGRRLAGEQLTAAICQLIDDSDGLIALKTRRERVGGRRENRWRSSPSIDDEYRYARDQGKQAIALVEKGVEPGGVFENYEHIPFGRSDLLEAFLRLSETLRLWKERIGIVRVVQIWPDDLSSAFRTNPDLKCRYRFIRKGVRGQWAETEPVLQPKGTGRRERPHSTSASRCTTWKKDHEP